ncbi:MAG: DUF5777 family beta-barrel protein, partial [Blastocatellia bacterium]
VNARPEYLKIFAADPLSRPELRNKCSVCHINPEGSGPRNEFGRAFAAAGFEINADLRKQFPDRFLSPGEAQKLPVTFVQGSDAEAIVELNGRKYVINTKAKTVTELDTVATAAPPVEKTTAQEEVRPDIYRQYDVRLVNLPTATPIPKGSLWTDFTHRFPFGDPTSGASLFGLDTIALPSFGFTYGITDRFHVGAYRSPGDLGRPIQLFAGASLLSEQKGDPLSLMARVGLEGRDNFKRNFTTSFELTFARSITRHAQLYFVPTISVGDRPLNFDPEVNLPSETAYALGIGAAVNVRPSVALMAEANYRLNEEARYVSNFSGIRRPVIGLGIQKASISRRHTFSLTFSNGPGTTFSQRSMTRGLQAADDSFRGLTIGFNLSRRLF